MYPAQRKAGEPVIVQGEPAQNYFVVDVGKCDVFIRRDFAGAEELVLTIGSGASFGEIALMYDCHNSITIKAHQEVTVWTIDRKTFRSIVVHSTSRKRRQYEMFLSKVKLFEALTSAELVTQHDLQITMRCLSGSHWRRLPFASDSWANRGSPGASGRLARGHHVPGRRYFDAGGRRGRLLLHLHQGHSLRDQQQSAPPPATCCMWFACGALSDCGSTVAEGSGAPLLERSGLFCRWPVSECVAALAAVCLQPARAAAGRCCGDPFGWGILRRGARSHRQSSMVAASSAISPD